MWCLAAGPGYKYKEVVRKKGDREAMLGVECADCQRFYEACQTWNSIAPASLPKCGHAVQGRYSPFLTGKSGPHIFLLLWLRPSLLHCMRTFNPAFLFTCEPFSTVVVNGISEHDRHLQAKVVHTCSETGARDCLLMQM